MSKIAFIYPGQGAQKAGMGADFYENCPSARELFDWRLMFRLLSVLSMGQCPFCRSN